MAHGFVSKDYIAGETNRYPTAIFLSGNVLHTQTLFQSLVSLLNPSSSFRFGRLARN